MTPHRETEASGSALWTALAAALLCLYAAAIWSLPALPLLDLPNHIARCFIIGRLSSDPVFAAWFSFEPAFTPYILGDLLLSSLISAVGAETAGRIWALVPLVGFVAGASFYARAAKLSPAGVRLIELLSLYLATNWFFLSAFSHFVIGFALSLFALGMLQRLLEAKRPRPLGAALYLLLVLATYLMHLAAAVFCGLVSVSLIAARAARRELPGPRLLAALLLPHAITGAAYLSNKLEQSAEYYSWDFRPPWQKITALGASFVRYDQWTDMAFTAAFLFVLYLFHVRTRQTPEQPAALRSRQEHTFVVLVLLGAYFALPFAVNTLSDIDTRALPYVTFMLAVAACSTAGRSSAAPRLLALGACLALLNFAYLASHLRRDSLFLAQYQEVFSRIPEHSRLFPVNTIADRGRIQSTLHASLAAVPARRTIAPYILSSNQGEPVTFFHYRRQLYEPSKFWYLRGGSVDWKRVADEFDFVIATRPHLKQQIALPRTRVAFANEAAVLYQVLKEQPPNLKTDEQP